jgi:hypothetical protein
MRLRASSLSDRADRIRPSDTSRTMRSSMATVTVVSDWPRTPNPLIARSRAAMVCASTSRSACATGSLVIARPRCRGWTAA